MEIPACYKHPHHRPLQCILPCTNKITRYSKKVNKRRTFMMRSPEALNIKYTIYAFVSRSLMQYAIMHGCMSPVPEINTQYAGITSYRSMLVR